MFHGDANFSDFSVLGAQSVMAGMDFDADGNAEILFTIDETLPPGGPDPGKVGDICMKQMAMVDIAMCGILCPLILATVFQGLDMAT